MQTINQWLTLIANIGVVLGLLLVAAQLQQTNEALTRDQLAFEVDNFQLGSEAMQSFYLSVLSDDDLRDLWIRGARLDDLTDDEIFVYDKLAEMFARNFRTMHDIWERAGEGRGKFAVNELVSELKRHPGMRASFRRFIRLEKDEGEVAEYFLVVLETIGNDV